MFKRITKRQRRREKEEELGLDEEMKQVLGLQDTDSDESSDSSSDRSDVDSGLDSSGESSVDGENSIDHKQALKRKRSAHAKSDFDGIPGENALSDMEGLDADPNNSEEDMDDDGPPMSVMSATTNPIYNVPGASSTQDLCACIVCPGKLLKHTKMVEVHLESAAHLRRLRRYTAHVSLMAVGSGRLNTDDPRDVLRNMSDANTFETPDQSGSSKRSQRRTQWKAKQANRQKARRMAKAKITPDKAEEALTIAKGGHDPREENRTKNLGKKSINDADAISVSIPFDPAATLNHRQRRNGETKVKGPPEPDSDARTRERPTKRLKRLHTDPSAPVNKEPSGSQATTNSKKFEGRILEPNKPSKLKRHTTSLADNEMLPSSPARLPPRSRKAGRHVLPNEAKEKKIVPSVSGTARTPSSRHAHREGKGSAPKHSFKRVREKNRGE